MDVVAFGETMAMLAPKSDLRAGGACAIHVGGAESNVVSHLARLGFETAWVSAVGDDLFGRLVVDDVRAAGVDVAGVRIDPEHRTGLYVKETHDGRTTVRYYRDGSAAADLGRDDVARIASSQPRIVLVSGISAAISASAAEALDAIVRERAVPGAQVVFDVNHRPSLWRAGAASTLRGLARASDVVLVGRDEAAQLWGTSSADDVRSLLPEPTLVVKDGGVEAVAFSGGNRWAVATVPVPVIEPVGAGDAFAGGWLAGALAQLDHPARLQLGHAVAARVLGAASDTVSLPGLDVLLRSNDQKEHRV